MAVIKIDFDKIDNITLPALRKELSILKLEKEFIDSNSLKSDSEFLSVCNSINKRYDSVLNHIQSLNSICNSYKKNIKEGTEAINEIDFPSIEKPPFSVN